MFIHFIVNLFELEYVIMVNNDLKKEGILEIYNTPLMELIYKAAVFDGQSIKISNL